MINSIAGTITYMNLEVVLGPKECMLYESCVREVLCKVSECIVYNGGLYVNWIW